MPGNLVRNTEDYGLRARRDRSIQSGRVLVVNRTTNTAILDVGMVDNDGNPVYLTDVPFSPQTPPQFNDIVAIHRTSSSQYSMVIGAGAQVGGGNSGQVVDSAGVNSIKKTGETTGQQGDIEFAPGANVTITRAGKKFTIAASAGGGTSPSWDLLTTGDVAAPELVFAGGNVIWVSSP
jgi:hypothetical protein